MRAGGNEGRSHHLSVQTHYCQEIRDRRQRRKTSTITDRKQSEVNDTTEITARNSSIKSSLATQSTLSFDNWQYSDKKVCRVLFLLLSPTPKQIHVTNNTDDGELIHWPSRYTESMAVTQTDDNEAEKKKNLTRQMRRGKTISPNCDKATSTMM